MKYNHKLTSKERRAYYNKLKESLIKQWNEISSQSHKNNKALDLNLLLRKEYKEGQ